MSARNLSPLARVALGGLAGMLATAPMSAVMLAGKQAFARTRHRPLPPTRITKNTLCALGVRRRAAREVVGALTAVNHFGYGAGMGAVYGLSANEKSSAVSYAVGQGVGFGLGVWTLSYLGWLPASKLYPSATREPFERNALMIAAHVVWGGSLGYLFAELARRQSAAQYANCSRRAAAPEAAENPVGV